MQWTWILSTGAIGEDGQSTTFLWLLVCDVKVVRRGGGGGGGGGDAAIIMEQMPIISLLLLLLASTTTTHLHRMDSSGRSS